MAEKIICCTLSSEHGLMRGIDYYYLRIYEAKALMIEWVLWNSHLNAKSMEALCGASKRYLCLNTLRLKNWHSC